MFYKLDEVGKGLVRAAMSQLNLSAREYHCVPSAPLRSAGANKIRAGLKLARILRKLHKAGDRGSGGVRVNPFCVLP